YRNYWNIRHNLPRETAGYLPAFLANMYIFEYAEQHGFKRYKPELAYFETDTVRVKHMITLDHVSEATGTPIEELQFLNPSYKLDIIPYIKGENYALRLPRDVVGTFVNNEDKIYAFAKTEFDTREKPIPQFSNAESKTKYRVKSGDYLGKISRLYGVRVSDIKKWNGLRSNDLKIGQNLTIYPRKPNVNATSSAKTVVKPKPLSGKVINYTVINGDSLWSISQKFPGVSVQNIKDWNGISGSKLKPGMILKISKG
ncbi:LysM peptidoglycan-binding domain-containing protein, partial [Algibacter sp.]|uniref:LysM peptidoglycan-binding domain-containing protein n=1 Tax=Algibacter sp. TaxID=1872428 RepID=UPI003C77DD2F